MTDDADARAEAEAVFDGSIRACERICSPDAKQAARAWVIAELEWVLEEGKSGRTGWMSALQSRLAELRARREQP